MMSTQPVHADGATIFMYAADMAPLVHKALEDAYQMLQSSLPFFRVFRSLEGTHCYIDRRGGRARTVLLFTCRKRRVDVLNEMIEIDQGDLERFTACVFSHFETVDIISFKAIRTPANGLRFPLQQHASKDTYVIALPETPEQYTSSIGKSTRANIRQQTNGLHRHFPTFKSLFFTKADISAAHIRAIIGFSETKINAKGVAFSYDVDSITRLARECGFVNIFSIDGRICAGSINYQVDTSYFGEVTGYDPEFEKFGLGKLCVHQTICESIARGGKKFYLGGGVFDFKQRLLGEVLSMDEVHLYRSRFKQITHADVAARALIVAQVRRLKKMLHRKKQEKWAQLVFKSAYFIQNKLSK